MRAYFLVLSCLLVWVCSPAYAQDSCSDNYLLNKDDGTFDFFEPTVVRADTLLSSIEVEDGNDLTLMGNQVLLTDGFRVEEGGVLEVTACTETFNDFIYMEQSEAVMDVFPNPTSGGITVGFELASDSEMQLQVMDAYGKVLQQFSQAQFFPRGPHTLRLDLSNLPNGFYVLLLQGEGFSTTHRVIKQ
jgi:hypothetical protein